MKYSRRLFSSTAIASAAFALSGAARADECAVFTTERQQAKTPDEALQLLKEGNERFLAGKMINCDLMAQVRATSHGQAPFAAIVGCIDSRVPPELIFDLRLGDAFVARLAGNIVDTDVIGSLEFSTKVMGAKAVLVLGHSDCGAIKGAIDNVKLGSLTELLAKIEPAVKVAEALGGGDPTSKNKAFVQAVADANAKLGAQMLMDRSEILRGLVEAKELVIVPAMQDLATGKVTFFS
jgi:carbonic anhydrase